MSTRFAQQSANDVPTLRASRSRAAKSSQPLKPHTAPAHVYNSTGQAAGGSQLGSMLDSLERNLVKDMLRARAEVGGALPSAGEGGSVRSVSPEKASLHKIANATKMKISSFRTSSQPKSAESPPLRRAASSHLPHTDKSPPVARPKPAVALANKVFARLQARRGSVDARALEASIPQEAASQSQEARVSQFLYGSDARTKSTEVDLSRFCREDPEFLQEVRRKTKEVMNIRSIGLEKARSQKLMASYSGRVREVETWYENTVSQSLRTALPDRSKQLHQVAWNRSLGDADLFAEKMKLEFSVSEVMEAVADVLAEEFNVARRGNRTSMAAPHARSRRRDDEVAGFPIGIPPSAAVEGMGAADVERVVAAKTVMRPRGQRPNPSSLMVPLDWEMTVVNYDESANKEYKKLVRKVEKSVPSYMMATEASGKRTQQASPQHNHNPNHQIRKREFEDDPVGPSQPAVATVSAPLTASSEVPSSQRHKKKVTGHTNVKMMHASVQLGGSALPRIETHSRLSGEDVSVFSVSRHSITPLGRSRDSAASRDVRAPSRQLESPGFLPNLNDQSEHNVWFSEIHPNDEDEDEEDDEEEHLPPEAEAANAAGTTRLPPPHKPGHRRSLVPEYESRAAKEWDRDNKHFDDAKAGRAFDVHEGLDKPMRREVTRRDAAAATNKYEAKCKEMHIVPLARVFEQMQRTDAFLGHCNLASKGGLALAECLTSNKIVKNLDVESNDLPLPACHKLAVAIAANRNLTRVNLAGNRLGKSAIRVLAEGFKRTSLLKEVVLNHCGLGNESAVKIARSLLGNVFLKSMSLQHNKIGDAGAVAIGDMLVVNEHLQHLDLSWNVIKPVGGHALGAGLSDNTHLHTLNMSWNGLSNEGGVMLGMMLHTNRGLTTLDLSSNRMGPEAAFVMAEALKRNPTLETLNVADNPLGGHGIRHLMAAIQVNSHLADLNVQGCSISNVSAGGVAEFHPRAAQGKYTLALADPLQRTVAMQLIELGRRKPATWLDESLDGQPFQFNASKMNWPEKLPRTGTLFVNFVRILGKPKELQALDPEDLRNLARQLQGKRLSDGERLDLARTFLSSVHLTCQQVPEILVGITPNTDEKINAVIECFGSILDTENLETLFQRLLPTEARRVEKELGAMRWFQTLHPTGHYELDLALKVDRIIARKLVDAAYSEGARMTWRNVTHGGKRWHTLAGAPLEWKGQLPSHGVLSLDYVCFDPPDPDLQLLTEEQLAFLLFRVSPSKNPDAIARVLEIRISSVGFRLTCKQCCTLISLFQDGDEMAEVAVLCFPRIVDREKFWQVMYRLSALAQSSVASRLGYGLVFNEKHPSMHYRLDTSNPEHMKICMWLVDEAQVNKSVQSWYNVFVGGKLMRSKIVEDSSMWSVLAILTPTPLVELDFYGADVFTSIIQAPPGPVNQQNDTTRVLARRAILMRCVQMHPYWVEAKGWSGGPPESLKEEHMSLQEENIMDMARESLDKSITKSVDKKNKSRGAEARKKERLPEEERLFVPEDAITVKFTNARWHAMCAPIPDGSLVKALQRLKSSRVHHWQISWDRMMREMVHSDTCETSPLYDHIWNLLDVKRRGMLTLKDFKRGIKIVLGTDATISKSTQDSSRVEKMIHKQVLQGKEEAPSISPLDEVPGTTDTKHDLEPSTVDVRKSLLATGSMKRHMDIRTTRLVQLYKRVDANLDGLMQFNEFEDACLENLM